MTQFSVAVAYTAGDVEHFSQSGLSAAAILSLSPNAMLAAKRSGFRVIDAGRRYTDCRQARTIVRREQIRQAWLKIQGVETPVDDIIAYTLDFALVILFHGYDRLHCSLGKDGPWLVRDGESWRLLPDRKTAVVAAGAHILSFYRHFLGTYPVRPPTLPALFRLLQRMALRLVRRPAMSWASARADHPLGLEKALQAQSVECRQWYLGPAGSGNLEYARLARETWRLLRGHQAIQWHVVPRRRPSDIEEARRRVALLPEPRLRPFLEAHLPLIADLCALGAALSHEYTTLLQRLSPDFILCSEVADINLAALFTASGHAGIPTTIASHNSFAPAADRLDAVAVQQQFLHQHAYGRAASVLMRWPPSLAAAEQVAAPRPGQYAALAADKLPEMRAENTRTPGAFRILHASNCQRFFSPSAWLYETVSEMTEAAVVLAEQGLKVPNTEYVIRTKYRRHEIDAGTLQALLPTSDRVRLKFRHDNPFQQDLLAADLVVAFRSTTILQALLARRPVLLWSVTSRYRDLKGQTSPPWSSQRAAVYSVSTPEELPDMLAAIRDAHLGRPLTDDELAPYRWPDGTQTPDTWARKCLQSASV